AVIPSFFLVSRSPIPNNRPILLSVFLVLFLGVRSQTIAQFIFLVYICFVLGFVFLVSVLSRSENSRRGYRKTRVDSTFLRRHFCTRSNRRRSKLAHPDLNLALLSLFPPPSHPLPGCLLLFYAHLDVAGNFNCVR
ncbi:hypothetical protein L210DRAFT_3631330, partial [Boletus edulis BED1]